MEFQDAARVLKRLPRFEVKPGLHRIQALLRALDHPHRRYPTVHVAGTNGKGSVVAMLDAVLRASGLRTGRYTSPEMIDLRDRITVDGEWISEAAWVGEIEQMTPLIEALEDPPSQFELITAIAFDHLARSRVEIAVIEVGLGGRYDATNVISPELCLLTNVSLDHQQLLGDTVERIAWEKAGIAKAGCRLLLGDVDPSVRHVVREECRRVGGILDEGTDVRVQRVARDWQAARYRVDGVLGVKEVVLPLIGSAQRENLCLVLRAVVALRARGVAIPDHAVTDGLRSVLWPGRLEVMQRRPTVVLDGAHNAAGIRSLAADVAELVPEKRRRGLLFGTLRDKDLEAALGGLSTVFPAISVCASSSPRAMPVEELAARAHARFSRVAVCDTVLAGIDAWLTSAGEDDVLFVTGSLTVVGEARRRWMN
jgi:dihydrofolate synthase / folylpolyglutamate synthase